MAKFYKRKEDGLYETSKTYNGKRKKFRGKTIKDVEEKIKAYEKGIGKSREFGVIVDEWFEEHSLALSLGSVRVYQPRVARIKEYFKGVDIKEIAPINIKRYMKQFETEGRSKSSAEGELSTIKMLFAHAVLAGDIDINPATEVKVSRGLPSKKRSALTVEQERVIENNRTARHWLFAFMLLFTGCRRGELLALNWQDIDRQAKVIHVTKKLNYSAGKRPILETRLKSENGKRDVPLLKPLEDALPDTPHIGAIFTNDDGEYWGKYEADKYWQEYCEDVGFMVLQTKKNGLTKYAPAITPHCVRHSFSTICFEAGVDEKTAAAYLGDTEEIMRRVYTELRSHHKAIGVERLNAYFADRQAQA